MRRMALIAALLALLGAKVAGIDLSRLAGGIPGAQFFGINAPAPGNYRVDAIFDTAKGIIPGQLVKVAGVRVGMVQGVTLTRDFKARVQIEVDPRFAPFHADARCEIRPEGLTAENFIQCEPGSVSTEALTSSGDVPPTVPVANTSVPVNLNGLFQVWTAPTAQRLTILVNELGIGLAARGDDVNAILRRTNPALTQARRVIGILDSERNQLATVVDGTDQVASRLAARPDRVTDFISQATRLSETTAAHGVALAEGIHRLPALLRASEPTLRKVDSFAVAARPTVAALGRSAVPFSHALTNLQSFAATSDPVLRGLRKTIRHSLPALRRARPTLAKARRFTTVAKPVAPVLSSLFTNLRDRGLIEGTLKLFYYLSAASARFDATSHVLPAHLILNDCVQYTTSPTPGCSAHYYDQPGRTNNGVARARAQAAGAGAVRILGRRRPKPAPEANPAPGGPPPSPPPPTPGPKLPPVHIPDVHLPPIHLPPVLGGNHGGHGGAHHHRHRTPVDDLLDYLLG